MKELAHEVLCNRSLQCRLFDYALNIRFERERKDRLQLAELPSCSAISRIERRLNLSGAMI